MCAVNPASHMGSGPQFARLSTGGADSAGMLLLQVSSMRTPGSEGFHSASFDDEDDTPDDFLEEEVGSSTLFQEHGEERDEFDDDDDLHSFGGSSVFDALELALNSPTATKRKPPNPRPKSAGSRSAPLPRWIKKRANEPDTSLLVPGTRFRAASDAAPAAPSSEDKALQVLRRASACVCTDVATAIQLLRPLCDASSEEATTGQVQAGWKCLTALVAQGGTEACTVAAELLAKWTMDDDNKVALGDVDGLPIVLRLVQSPECAVHLPAAKAMANLSFNYDKQKVVQTPGCLYSLIALLSSEVTSDVTKEHATRALRNLAVDDDQAHGPARTSLIVQAGALPALVALRGRPHPQLQEQAARALGNLAVNDENEARILEAGGVTMLLELLRQSCLLSLRFSRQSDLDVLDAALGALANLVANADIRSLLVSSGGLPSLLRVMDAQGEGERFHKHLGWILAALAVDPVCGERVVEQGGVKVLVAHAGSPDEQLQEEAAWALANLSTKPANALAIMEAGGLPPLIKLGSSPNHNVQMQAVWALANLAVHDELKRKIGEEGGALPLLEMLCSEDEMVQTQAARAVANLAVEDSNRQILVESDGLPPLIELAASSSNQFVQEAVARALVNISYEGGAGMQIVELGGLVPLIRLLGAESHLVQQEAAWATVNLSISVENEGPMIDAGVIPPLVELLRSEHKTIQEQAAWALANLSVSDENRMHIITGGALIALKHLKMDESNEVQAASTKALDNLGKKLTPNSRRIITRGKQGRGHPGQRENVKHKRSPLAPQQP